MSRATAVHEEYGKRNKTALGSEFTSERRQQEGDFRTTFVFGGENAAINVRVRPTADGSWRAFKPRSASHLEQRA